MDISLQMNPGVGNVRWLRRTKAHCYGLPPENLDEGFKPEVSATLKGDRSLCPTVKSPIIALGLVVKSDPCLGPTIALDLAIKSGPCTGSTIKHYIITLGPVVKSDPHTVPYH
ncbi:hypothetical protein F4604DRAFT_1674762 [Suillus subluteus]|nr:hypothetical protein F4604DRAFT_1674762 [Suillus subluteus]